MGLGGWDGCVGGGGEVMTQNHGHIPLQEDGDQCVDSIKLEGRRVLATTLSRAMETAVVVFPTVSIQRVSKDVISFYSTGEEGSDQ